MGLIMEAHNPGENRNWIIVRMCHCQCHECTDASQAHAADTYRE